MRTRNPNPLTPAERIIQRTDEYSKQIYITGVNVRNQARRADRAEMFEVGEELEAAHDLLKQARQHLENAHNMAEEWAECEDDSTDNNYFNIGNNPQG